MERENEVKNSDDRQTDSRQRVGMRSSDDEVSAANQVENTIKVRDRISASLPNTLPSVAPLRSRGGADAPAGTCADAREGATRAHEQRRTQAAKITNFEVALDHVSKLDRKQAKQMLAQLSLRMETSDKAVQNRDLEAWCASVHAELSKELGTDRAYGLMQVRKALSEPEHWEPVEAFMEAANFDQYTSAQRRAMYMLLAEMVLDRAYEDTKRFGGTVTLLAIGRCTVDLVRIFDDAFPGYLRSGLAFMVAEQQQRIATGKTSV